MTPFLLDSAVMWRILPSDKLIGLLSPQLSRRRRPRCSDTPTGFCCDLFFRRDRNLSRTVIQAFDDHLAGRGTRGAGRAARKLAGGGQQLRELPAGGVGNYRRETSQC